MPQFELIRGKEGELLSSVGGEFDSFQKRWTNSKAVLVFGSHCGSSGL